MSVGETSGATGPRAALHLIGSRNFGPYFVGNAASASGTWFQNLAASLLVYRQTHSPFLLGVLNYCNFIPDSRARALGGQYGPTASTGRRIIVVTQLGSTGLSALLAALAWSGRASVPVVLVCALGLGWRERVGCARVAGI